MTWVAVDYNGDEWMYDNRPYRYNNHFWMSGHGNEVLLPKGSIKKLIGSDLTWKDDPVSLKEK